MTSPTPRIYAIADATTLGSERLVEGVRTMAATGIEWIQLRMKDLADDEMVARSEACCRAVEGTEARLWIDDRPDLAALLPFRGVHLGQSDLPPTAARKVVGAGVALGLSTHDSDQTVRAQEDPDVDVVACGPVFPTRSKAGAHDAIGLEGVTRARRETVKPLVAIGGIDVDSVAAVLAAGADSVAMIGAICRGDIEHNCRRLLRAAA